MKYLSRRAFISALLILLSGSYLVVATIVIRAHAQNDIPAPGDFLRGYREILHQCETLYSNARITGSHQTSYSTADASKDHAEGPPAEETSHFSYTFCDGSERLDIRRENPRYFNRVLVNERGGKFFAVRRTAPDSSYYLEKLRDTEVRTWESAFLEFRHIVKEAAYTPPGCLFLPEHPSYPSLVDSSDFKVQRVTRTPDGAGRAMLKIDFKFLPADPNKPHIEGWLTLDPSMNLAIQEYDYERRDVARTRKGQVKLVFHYSGSVHYKQIEGRAVPSEIKYTKSSSGMKEIQTYNISDFGISTTPPQDFTLAAFGLGDVERTIDDVKRRNTYWNFALALVAVVAISMSFVLFRIGRAIQRGRANRMKSSNHDQP